MNLNQDIFNSAIISSIFIIIFLCSELLSKFKNVEIEKTRKFVHFSAGTICLSFPFIFTSHYTVLLLTISFLLIMVISKKLKLLQSIHGVERSTQGGVYFPLAVYLSFFISSKAGQEYIYVISILILAISDALAALIGKKYGRIRYLVEDDNKSLEGSLAFLVSSFVICSVALVLFTDLPTLNIILLSAYLALIVSVIEAISLSGTDNLFIPFIVSLILIKSTHLEIELLFQYFLSLLIITAGMYFIGRKSKVLGISGLLGIGLASFATYSLIGTDWFFPIFIGLLFYTFIIKEESISTDDPINHRIRSVYLFLSVSVLWVFIANYNYSNYQLFFIPFIINVILRLSIQWKRKYLYLNDFKSFVIRITSLGRITIIGLILIVPSFLLFKYEQTLLSTLLFSIIFAVIAEFIFDKLIGLGENLDTVQVAKRISLISLSVSIIATLLIIKIIPPWLLKL